MSESEMKHDKKYDPGQSPMLAGIPAIPVNATNTAAIFLNAIVNPLLNRGDKWVESISAGLIQMKTEHQTFDIEKLSDNEEFVTTLTQASQIAMRTHQNEKLNALRNAVLNTCLSDGPDEELKMIFLSSLDVFVASHLTLLQFLHDPREWAKKNGITYPNWSLGVARSTVLEHAVPKFLKRAQFYNQLAKDLFLRGLIADENLNVTMSVNAAFNPLTTEIGKMFINFINSPLPQE